MANEQLMLVKGSNESAQQNKLAHQFDHMVTVAQNGAFLVDAVGRKYDLFNLPADKTFFVDGNLVLDSMDLKELPEGLNRVVVSKDLFIDNNPLETLKNYPSVLGRTHINPIIRYVENPSVARLVSARDLVKDGTITKLANGRKTFFIGVVDAVFLNKNRRPAILNRHEALLDRCETNAIAQGCNNPNRVCRRFGLNRFDPSRNRE